MQVVLFDLNDIVSPYIPRASVLILSKIRVEFDETIAIASGGC